MAFYGIFAKKSTKKSNPIFPLLSDFFQFLDFSRLLDFPIPQLQFVLGCSGLYWAILDCTGLYWAQTGFTGGTGGTWLYSAEKSLFWSNENLSFMVTWLSPVSVFCFRVQISIADLVFFIMHFQQFLEGTLGVLGHFGVKSTPLTDKFCIWSSHPTCVLLCSTNCCIFGQKFGHFWPKVGHFLSIGYFSGVMRW